MIDLNEAAKHYEDGWRAGYAAAREADASPGYRYPVALVDKAADLLVRHAGGFDESRWTTDPRNTAQAVFDAFLAHIAPTTAATESEAR